MRNGELDAPLVSVSDWLFHNLYDDYDVTEADEVTCLVWCRVQCLVWRILALHQIAGSE